MRSRAMCCTTRLILVLALLALSTADPAAQQLPQPAPAADDLSLVDLTRAAVVAPAGLNLPERTAVRVLVEEIAKRTNIRLPVSAQWPADTVPVIAVGPISSAASWAGAGLRGAPSPAATPGREGYRVAVNAAGRRAPTVLVLGADSRGVLFGVGKLLREARMTRGSLRIPAGLSVVSTPEVPSGATSSATGRRPTRTTRGTYPSGSRYIRDLAIFGSNAIELIPPRSDDAADSPHFPLPQIEMMVGMSQIVDDYGAGRLDLVPRDRQGLLRSGARSSSRSRSGARFSAKLPRVDAVFVPGGDPGHTQPKHLMALLEKQTASPPPLPPEREDVGLAAGLHQEWMDEFYQILKPEPAWLTGLVFGPQVRDEPAGAARAHP